MKFYKDPEDDTYFIEFLIYDDMSYYFWLDSSEKYIEVQSAQSEWVGYTPIEYKDLPDKMKAFLKSIRFKSAMKGLLDG